MNDDSQDRILVSVIIKTLNEAENIARSIESALAATRGYPAEVIVADSLSTDATVTIAKRYPVRVVQLTDPTDRSCGVGAQLGWQYARGEYVYILDGDMALDPGFVTAGLAAFAAAPRLAGVAGQMIEESDAAEYQLRKLQQDPSFRPGPVDRLNSGGMYRRTALEDVGYFTDRNLHSFEELELGLRLGARGWQLERLAVPGCWHRGHGVASAQLLVARWRSGYAWGLGEVLRACWGRPKFGVALKQARLFFGVLGWWLALLVLFVLAFRHPPLWRPLLAAGAAPVLVMALRKRSVSLGVYAVCAWCVITAGLIAGFVRPRRDPRAAIAARVV